MKTTPVESQQSTPTNAEIIYVLADLDLFDTLSYANLERLIAAGQQRRLEQGDYLFRAGDPPDSVHVLLAGAIEVARSTPDNPEPTSVVYLAFPGETIGDMALFTRSPRTSAGRAPEFADVLTLGLPVIEELTRTVPGYGLTLATVFARRLEGCIRHGRRQKRRRELSGKLRFFDLATVVQTLVAARLTGVLTLVDDEGKTYGQLLLLDGSVDRARCGILEGAEAVHQLFHYDDDGEFFFRTEQEPDPESISKIRISLTATHLLLESMRLMDEFPSVRRRLPDPEKPYQARTQNLQWEDDSTVTIAQEVLAKLREPRAIADLINHVPCNAFTLYRIAAELWESDQIR